jgi:hypothetical protein
MRNNVLYPMSATKPSRLNPLTFVTVNDRGLFRAALGVAVIALASCAGTASAQEMSLTAAATAPAATEVSSSADASASPASALPDSPGYAAEPAMAGEGAQGNGGPRRGTPRASHFDKVIEPNQTAEKLSIGDKVLMGFRENATLTSLGGWVLSASYEQIVDGSPNYGQTGKGYAQRLGAAAARGVSENVFSDSVIAPIMHIDPRYYKMGPGHNFFKRVAYAGTRGIITKTDGGHTMINFANIGGDLGGSALTQLYYPSLNRNFTQVMQTWGGSIGGDAVGYLANEFLSGALTTMHLSKKQ